MKNLFIVLVSYIVLMCVYVFVFSPTYYDVGLLTIWCIVCGGFSVFLKMAENEREFL